MLITLLCVFLIGCSFTFSSSEIAVFSISRVQLKRIKDQSDTQFKRIRELIHDSIGFLITVLLFNEVVNIALASIITSHVIEPLHLDWHLEIFAGVLITTPIVLLLCDLTPKVVASRANHLILSAFLPLVFMCYRVTKPLVSVLKLFLPKQPVKELQHLQEEDFIILAEEQTETGALHETELELIKNVFEMDDMPVEQLATPMKKVTTIPSTHTVEQAFQVLLKEKIYSRVPISGKFKEDIVGVLHTKDLVELKLHPELKTENVMSFAKEPFIVSGKLTTETLFRKMKTKKIQVAFIKNSQNRITGMIALQDILDAIIDEAFDE